MRRAREELFNDVAFLRTFSNEELHQVGRLPFPMVRVAGAPGFTRVPSHEARKRGTRIVVVNPFREPALERYWVPSAPISALFGTPLMDDYFAVQPGGDIAFIYGALKAMTEFDDRFIAAHTEGFEELRRR